MRVGADTKITPAQEFCVGDHQQIVNTVVHTDTVVHIPRGGNTVDKLNMSKSSGHVNILRLMLPLVLWWCCCCILFLLAMEDGEFDHSGGGGGGGGPAAAAALAVAAVDNDWRRKRPATRASTVA